jgi:hypothetical protein
VGKINNSLKVTCRQVQQQAYAAGDAPGIPDVAYRAGQIDVAHSFPADFGLGYFNLAFITDNPFIADALVLAAGAFKVLGRTKNSLAKKAVTLRFKGSVINCFWFGYLAIRPSQYLVW